MSEKKAFKIGIAGLGTVGCGVIKLLQKNADQIALKTGRHLEISAVSARHKNKERSVDVSAYQWIDDPSGLAHAPEIDCVVELIGGSDGVARDLVGAALSNKKHVVSANKALIAHHGTELATLAEENRAQLFYEAAVAGGIPIIKTLREGLAGNKISGFFGILNGTSNYILSEMRKTGRDFGDVLKEAQDKGYAEADPAFDINGTDTAHKLSILSALAFGAVPDFDNIKISGIDYLTSEDIAFAEELGYRIKLLGVGQKVEDAVFQDVSACLVPGESTFGHVEGPDNAVQIFADAVGQVLNVGLGAGKMPTASAVVADIMDIASGLEKPVFGLPMSDLQKMKSGGAEILERKHYLHLKVIDQPGVVAEIAAILRDHDISIESFIQRGRRPKQAVSLVMVTHESVLSAMSKAVKAIADLSFLEKPPVCLRIEA